MKITGVQIYKLGLPTDNWLVLTIQTDEGLTGWGEVTGSCDDNGLARLLEEAGKNLYGKDPLHMMERTQPFYNWTYPVLDNIRTYATALSGIDQALWDITAKFYGLPLYKLYGASGVDSVPLYANLNKALRGDRSNSSLERNAMQAIESGFQMLKCTPFDEVSPRNCVDGIKNGLERLGIVANIADISKIAIDCHQRFTRYSLARMTEKVLEHYGYPFWIEDPVDVVDYSSMEQMIGKYPGVRWAAGEDAFTVRQLHATATSNCYEVLMPDVKYIGGPSIIRASIPYLEGTGHFVSIHNPNGIIATAHSAHLTALCRSEMPMEFPFAAVPHREELCDPNAVEQVVQGRYILSDRPGIGVELSEKTLNHYALRYHHGGWKPYGS